MHPKLGDSSSSNAENVLYPHRHFALRWWHCQRAKLAQQHGKTYALQGNHEAAIATFTQALTYTNAPAPLHVLRGLSYYAISNFTQALIDFDTAIEIDATCNQAYAQRGLLHANQNNIAAALADWEQALALEPNYSEIYYQRALLWLDQNRPEAALADFNQAITLNPGLIAAYLHRGNLRKEQGDLPGAMQDWEIALRNDLTLEKAQTQWLEAQQSTQDQSLNQALETALLSMLALPQLTDEVPPITIATRSIGTTLEITLHRRVGVGINYFTLPERLRPILMQQTLNGINRFKLIGKVGTVTQPEWSQDYDLYKGQPCPPSNWQNTLPPLVLFPPIGLAALLYAAKVPFLYKKGLYRDAVQASKTVTSLCRASTVMVFAITLLPLSYFAITSIQNEPTPPMIARSLEKDL
jgi:Tetratricopeptide repeat